MAEGSQISSLLRWAFCWLQRQFSLWKRRIKNFRIMPRLGPKQHKESFWITVYCTFLTPSVFCIPSVKREQEEGFISRKFGISLIFWGLVCPKHGRSVALVLCNQAMGIHCFPSLNWRPWWAAGKLKKKKKLGKGYWRGEGERVREPHVHGACVWTASFLAWHLLKK